ncbi:MAG: ComF family protein [Clostridia bacterium]|nr:ComF family protein [Clostridia bacterium]
MLNPVRIYGVWDEGIVLDNHMLKSIFIGYDENGKERFENTRTEIGELIYQLKYQKNRESLKKIMCLLRDILDRWNLSKKIDVVIPVPPSNKLREYQPVFEISKEIAAYLKKECRTDLLSKESNLQVKDGYNISGMIKKIGDIDKPANVLVIDDLYSTGATLNETCKILKNDINVKKIYCIAMTKTKG